MKLKVAGGGGGCTLFTDTLLRTATANLGAAWAPGFSDPSQVGFFSVSGGFFCNNTVGLTCKNNTGGGASCSMPVVATLLCGCSGLTQFSEANVSASAGVASFAAGPCVAIQGDSITGTANGYFLEINQSGNFNIRVANVGQRLVDNNTGSWSVGSVLRLSIQFGASANTLIVTKNGATLKTVTDNDATRPLAANGGLPGLYFKGASPANSVSFTNFRGGLGLG